jgi:hypothetical protein
MDPNQVDQGSGLSRQIGPLKLWQWGAVTVVVAAGYLWWRNRQSGSSSSAVDNSDDGTMNADVNSGDYSSGYDSGYASGLNASGSGGSTGTVSSEGNAQGPIAHNRVTAKVKNPAGKETTVVGYGTWVQKGGKWVWQVGIPRQFALVGNGVGTGASSVAADVPAAAVSGDSGTADTATTSPALATDGSAVTLDQATGTSSVGTSGGGQTGATVSGSSGTSAPKQTATNAQRIAQIVKDLQSPGPNFTAAQQQSYLSTYQQLSGHAYTGKLGQLQVGQHVQYATV